MEYFYKNVPSTADLREGWDDVEHFQDIYFDLWLEKHGWTATEEEFDGMVGCNVCIPLDEDGHARGFLYHAESLKLILDSIDKYYNEN